MSTRYLATIPLVAVVGITLTTAPALGWRYIDPQGPNANVRGMVSDPTGGVVITGEAGSSTAFVIKLDDVDGQVLWYRTDISGGSTAGGRALALNAVGDVFVVGGSSNVVTGPDFFVARLDGSTGAEVWRQDIDGTAVTNGDLAYDVAVDSAGDVVAVGVLDNAGTDEDLTVVKLDGVSGAEVWRLSVDGPGMRDEAFTVAVDAAGDAMVGGRIQNGFAVLKVDGALGAELWRYTLPSPIASVVNELKVTATGDVMAVGSVGVNEIDGPVAVKLDGSTGLELWRRELAGGEGRAAALDGSGHLVVGGNVGVSERDFLVWKLDGATGDDIWRNAFRLKQGPAKTSTALDIVVGASGDIYAGGGNGQFGREAVFRFDGATGDEVWRRLLREGNTIALVLDSAGDLVAAVDRHTTVTEMTADEGTVGPVRGASLSLKDLAGLPEKRKIVATLKDDIITTPTPGTTDDPTIGGGSVLISNPATSESETFVLPAIGWKGRGNPPGSKGYSYTGAPGEACSTVKAAPGKLLKLVCTGKRGPIAFSLDEESQGELEVSFQFGNGRPQCGTFGGEVKRDAGTSNPGPHGRFKAKRAPWASGDCPVP